MAKYKIAVLPGDGVGVEVIEAAMIVLDKLGLDAEYIYGDIGWEFWKTQGEALPEKTLDLIRNTDATLFGAITSKPKQEAEKELAPELKDKGFVYFSPIVKLRQALDLYVNQRPAKAYKGNPLNYKDDIDLIIFRENTEGMYAGVEFFPMPEDLKKYLTDNHPKMAKFKDVPCNEIAISTRIMTKKGCDRIIRAAFEYAKKNNKKSVTLVEKPNVLRETGGLILRVAREIAKEYPGIELWETNIDAMAMWLIKNPEKYGVIVAENLFGDIISDEAAQLIGGLGFACAGNIGENAAVFEPTHGSAPKYAGMYKVNPIACILAAKMMLAWLGEKDMAEKIDKAIAAVIEEGKVKTYDMGGTNTTLEVGKAIAERL
ncbi:isocitrate/isopropylmalate dehydrogenase family protein [Candidatus Dependentiae bacterium]|nr:isocitrate/isopropylmalate dehydrogenase family protein [Candidatus Dependentiae bacterium]